MQEKQNICDTCAIPHKKGIDIAGEYFTCAEGCRPNQQNSCPKHRNKTATEILRETLDTHGISYAKITDTHTYWRHNGEEYDATEHVPIYGKLDIIHRIRAIDANDIQNMMEKQLSQH